MSAALLAALAACTVSAPPAQKKPQQAGQGMQPVKVAAQMAAVHAAAAVGDQAAVQAGMGAMHEDFRRSIKLADPNRQVDRESARMAAWRVEGVRTSAWIDRENLLVIVDRNEARSYATIDAICLELEPLGDTLGVVVNLQSGAATNSEELDILSRNCQLAPGDQAFMTRKRQADVISPEIRAQLRANSETTQAAAAKHQREAEESLRIIKASTPEM